jgi:hypothetical protein
VGGAGIAFKATIAKKPDYYNVAKKSIVVLFHVKNEDKIQFQKFYLDMLRFSKIQ